MSRIIGGLVVCAALAACHQRAVTPREHVLAELPGTARVVLAADGPALSAHAVRGALDAARPFVPTTLGCVIDAAEAADAAALAIGPDGALVALATHAPIASCPALSHYEPGLWIATVGATAPADDRASSVVAAPAWARARAYLADAPLALALTEPRLVATARPEPLELWIAVDDPIDPLLVDAWRRARLAVTTIGTQLVARAPALDDGDLAELVRQTLRILVAAPPRKLAIELACTPGSSVVVRCSGREVVVRSLPGALRELAASADQPVVFDGDIVGIRVRVDALVFQAGDVILGFDAHRITSSGELARLADTARTVGTIAVRRGETEGLVDLRQEE